MLSPINAEQDIFVQRCLRELGMGYDGDENIVDLSQLTSDYVALAVPPSVAELATIRIAATSRSRAEP